MKKNFSLLKIGIFSFFFLFFLFFVPNLKIYFLAFVFSILVFSLFEADLVKAVWLSLILSLPFQVGKAIRTGAFYIPAIGEHAVKETFFYVTMANFLAFLLLWLFLRRRYFLKLKFHWWEASLLTFLSIALASSAVSVYPLLSFLFWLQIAGVVVFYFLGRGILTLRGYKDLIGKTKPILLAHVLFQGFLACVQYLKRGFVGNFIEEAQYQYSFGHFAVEEKAMFRSSGTLNHPNDLASFLVVVLPLVFFEILAQKHRKNYWLFCLASFILGVLGLVATLSRGAWLVFLLDLFVFYLILKKEKFKFETKLLKHFRWLIVPLVLFLPIIFKRVLSLSEAFSQKGSALVRLDLAKEALFFVKDSPWLGIGPGLFVPMLIERHRTDIVYIFPSLIHNTFLHIGAEMGLVALLFYLFFFTRLVKKNWRKKVKVCDLPLFWGGLIGLLNFFILSFGYPLFKPGLQALLFLFCLFLI
jgi:hypothetical protein